MNQNLIYKIREKPELYQYLKYNSYLYKAIMRNEISLKELENRMRQDLKITMADKINNLGQKIELANSFLNILR